MILLSVVFRWIGDMFPCQRVREEYSEKEFYTLYWQEVLKTVQTGGYWCRL